MACLLSGAGRRWLSLGVGAQLWGHRGVVSVTRVVAKRLWGYFGIGRKYCCGDRGDRGADPIVSTVPKLVADELLLFFAASFAGESTGVSPRRGRQYLGSTGKSG